MKKEIPFILILFFCINILFAQRQVEALNRGLIVIYPNATSAYIGWRLLAKDDWTMGFNIYRITDGAAAVKLNATPITNSTNFTDSKVAVTKVNSYFVRSVVDGVELETSETFTPEVNATFRQFFPISLQSTGTAVYDVLHVYVGDIDGDGDFDYIVKRVPQDATYNYILLECYDNNGVFKWKINLGPNVDTYISSMTAPVLVADFNGDGKAEIIAKTGEGTIFGNGTTIGDTDGDGKTDYNSHAGSGTAANIMTGPEFISLINGETGAEINRNNFITRGKSSDWGDNYGARMNFIMSSVGSFDGIKPGVIFSRGPGGVMAIEAWDVTSNKLTKKWNWSAKGKTFSPGGWDDFHQIQCIDVNADGKDEISWGSCMMNPNGTVRYTTELIHGDRFQITDMNPNRAGLEAFAIQQNNPSLIGSALYDASTGTMIKKWMVPALQDLGRGDVADVDPNSPGMELFDLGVNDLHASDGTEAVTGARPYPDVSIWWDADLLREFFVGIGGSGTNPAINKWNYTAKTEDRLFTMYNDFGSYSIISPYAGRAPFIGDIMGDWREEIILETADHTAIRVYTTKNETTYRIYTLMQDPAYRNATTSKGYLCTKYTDYFLGAGMVAPPKPNIAIIGVANNAPNVALSSPATGTSFTSSTAITISAVASDRDGTISKIDFYQGTTLIGSDDTAPYSFSWSNVTSGTYSITAKATDNSGAVTTSSAITLTVVKPAPVTYIYQCNACVDPSWTATTVWTPAAVPATNDTAIIRTGEVKVAQDITSIVKVETNGIFRLNANIVATDIRLQAGTLKSYTSNLLTTLTSTITAEQASTVMAGSLPASLFQILGTIQGSGNLTKTSVGVLQISASAANFKGTWNVTEGVLRISNANGLGQCGVVVDSTASLDFTIGSSTNAIVLKNGATLNLGANVTVQAAVFGNINVPAGTYTASSYPTFITGPGTLTVVKSLIAIGVPLAGSITLTANSGSSYIWTNSSGTTLATSTTFIPSGTESISLKATTAVGCIVTSTPISVQYIALVKGWNLISTNVRTTDSTITTLFNGITVLEIKTMDAFWRSGQNTIFNSLKTISTGNGYLININATGKFVVAGSPLINNNLQFTIKNGWQLIGCPYQTASPFSTYFTTNNCSLIKNFEGFWFPSGTTNSILNIEPGKGYFLKK